MGGDSIERKKTIGPQFPLLDRAKAEVQAEDDLSSQTAKPGQFPLLERAKAAVRPENNQRSQTGRPTQFPLLETLKAEVRAEKDPQNRAVSPDTNASDATASQPMKPGRTPAPARSMPDANILRAQAQLRVMEGYSGKISGKWKDSEQALHDFAAKYDLNIGADLKDPETKRRLMSEVANHWQQWVADPDNAGRMKSIVDRGWEVGSTNKASHDEVKQMQAAILAMGGHLPRFGMDGVYGHETAKALRKLMATDGTYRQILDAGGIDHSEWGERSFTEKNRRNSEVSEEVGTQNQPDEPEDRPDLNSRLTFATELDDSARGVLTDTFTPAAKGGSGPEADAPPVSTQPQANSRNIPKL